MPLETGKTSSPFAVVGAGASGALVALHLLRRMPAEVHLIESRNGPGRGVAYSTADPSHFLNVRAGRMGAFDDDPGHFATWLAERAGDGQDLTDRFLPRRIYGDYLADLLAKAAASGRLTCHRDRVEALAPEPEDVGLKLSSGRRLRAGHAILCLGNLPPDLMPALAPIAADPRYFADPWNDIADLPEGDLLVVGSGLTMVDLALSLERRGFRGRLLALSRHGLLPRSHGPATPIPPPPGLGRLPLSQATGLLRHLAGESDWRSAIDGLRPGMQIWWRDLPPEAKGRFLRHLRVWWDVHRHRLPPEAALRMEALRTEGRLVPLAGRLSKTAVRDEDLLVTWRPRGGDREETLAVGAIVNCSGPGGDITRSGDALLRSLLADGLARPDALGLGLDVDRMLRLRSRQGSPQDRIYAIGPLTRGCFWECTAVPEIRQQARRLADLLATAEG